MKICKICGDINTTTGQYCQSCYGYLRKHPEGVYPLPPKRQIVYADNGDPICHICGQAYRKLGNHIRFKHHLTQNEYRDMFGLYHNTKLSNISYRNKMAEYNKCYKDIVVDINLLKKGKKTRVSKKNNLAGRTFQYKIQEKEACPNEYL